MTNLSDGSVDLRAIAHIFAEKIPFNREMGFRFSFDDSGAPVLRFAHRPELVGNFVRGILHGGVIASALDVIGGFASFRALLDREDLSGQQAEEILGRMGTIDLRIDYLRPGMGEGFVATAQVLRVGRKVAVARMELKDDGGEMVSAGTGAYIVG